MAVMELNLTTLRDNLAGGRVGVAFEEELKRCVTDCEDRPGDSKPRVVTIQLKLEPVKDDSGFCEEVWGTVHVASTVPKRKTKPINFGVRRGGMLVFNDLSEDDINQQAID